MGQIKILKDVDFDKLYEESKKHKAAIADESDDYSSFDYEHGYGTLSKAGVQVSKGVSATVHIDMTLSTFAENSYSDSVNEMKNVLDTETTEHLNESSEQHNYSNWWFWLFSGSDSDYEHHKDSNTGTLQTTDTTVSNTLKKHFSKSSQDYHITGDFTVVGQSFQPTTAYLFVEMLKIKMKDGSTTTVINGSPMAADENGDTSTVSTDPDKKLNILPL